MTQANGIEKEIKSTQVWFKLPSKIYEIQSWLKDVRSQGQVKQSFFSKLSNFFILHMIYNTNTNKSQRNVLIQG